MILVLVYLLAVWAANMSLAIWGPPAAIVNAFLFIGLTFTTRDALHRAWSGKVRLRMLLLICAGGLLSYLTTPAAGQIALASVAAFIVSESADAIVYHSLRHRASLVRVNGSNLVGAAVDSLVFPTLAFGALLWPIIVGQFVAKVAGGGVWYWILRRRL